MKKLLLKSFLPLLTILSLTAARADEPTDADRYRLVEIQLRSNKQMISKIDAEMLKASSTSRQLRQAKRAVKGQGLCNDCGDIAKESCNENPEMTAVEACKNGSCEVPEEPKSNVCLRIFQNQGCYHNALTAVQRARVDRCFMVQNEFGIQNIQDHLADLRERKDRLLDSQIALRSEHAELFESLALNGGIDSGTKACTNCDNAVIAVKQPEKAPVETEADSDRVPASDANTSH